MTLTNNEKWNAVIHCDSTYDGVFVYGVKTTGIFCRPSCKSKEPLRSNVEFFEKINQAYAYGLRPCKRCRPDLLEFNPMQDLIDKAKYILDTDFDDREKAMAKIKKLGISQNHFIYLFRQRFAMTPAEYMNKTRLDKALQMLSATDQKILDIVLDCGFGSLSAFYEQFKKHVGLTPKEFRKAKNKDKLL